MLNEINGAAGLASPQATYLRLLPPPPYGWRSGENKDESGYKSLGSSRWMKPDAVGSHER